MMTFDKNNVDINKAITELIDGDGVILIKNVYSKDQINEARDIINRYSDKQDKSKLEQRVWNLFSKGKVFSDIITNDVIFELMSKFLGKEFICGSYAASVLLPGASGQVPHIDYPFSDYYNKETFPMRSNSLYPQNCQVTIPLEIFSEESGATGYYPGTQKILHFPTKEDNFSNLRQMVANTGDLVFFYGMVWHCAMPNKTANKRTGLLIELLPKYVKPLEDFFTHLDKDFIDNNSNRVKQLLGLQYPYPVVGETFKPFSNSEKLLNKF